MIPADGEKGQVDGGMNGDAEKDRQNKDVKKYAHLLGLLSSPVCPERKYDRNGPSVQNLNLKPSLFFF